MRIARGANQQNQSCFPPTTAQEMSQRFRAPQWSRAAVQSRRIPQPGRRPPSAPQRSRRYISFLPSLRMARPGLQHAPEIAAAGMIDVRRRQRQRFGNDLARSSSSDCWNSGYFAASFCENAAISAQSCRIVIEDQRAPIRRERSHGELRRNQLQPVLLELHVADDLRTKRRLRSAPASRHGIQDGILR